MAKFQFNVLTNDPNRLNVISAKLGVDAAHPFTDKDIKKAVKLAALNNFVLCADGDELDGFVDNIDGGGTEDGFSFGGVARPNGGQRFEVKVAAGATAVVVGDLVVAGAQLALGTTGLAQVKKGTPALHKWRVMNLLGGAGAAGTTIVIEKV